MSRWIRPGRVLAAFVFVAGLAAAPVASAQQQQQDRTSAAEVRKEVSEAMATIRDYSADRRDEAVKEIDGALEQLDAEIDRQEQRLRENWAEMSTAARKEAEESAAELRRQRNRLSEWEGALRHGTKTAWDDVKTGFIDAYEDLKSAWEDADRDAGQADRKDPPG